MASNITRLTLRAAARRGFVCVQRSSSRVLSTTAAEQALATFSEDKMDADKRYQATTEVPASLSEDFDSEFSIRGEFRDGRAAYLDHSATTPLDPRVLDVMAPFMVSCLFNTLKRAYSTIAISNLNLLLLIYRLVRLAIHTPVHTPSDGKQNVSLKRHVNKLPT